MSRATFGSTASSKLGSTKSVCGWCAVLRHRKVSCKYAKVEKVKPAKLYGITEPAGKVCELGIKENRDVECERHPCQSRFFRQHLTCEDWCPVPFVKQ